MSLFKYLLIIMAALTQVGCSASEFYDPSTQAPAYAPRQQMASTHTATDHSSALQTNLDSSQPQPTVLHEGDTVKISFPGSPNLDETEQIRLDGKISLALVGDVQAAGQTPDQLQEHLIKLYAPQISSSDVTVAIISSTFPVYVTGCVLRPGKILSDRPLTALEAVMEAGGFDYARANLRNVHVVRRQKDSSQSYILNLKAVLNGDEQNDFFMQPGDVVYVPEKFAWF